MVRSLGGRNKAGAWRAPGAWPECLALLRVLSASSQALSNLTFESC